MKNKTVLIGVGFALFLLLILAIYYMTAFQSLNNKISELKATREEYNQEYNILSANIGHEDVLKSDIEEQKIQIDALKEKLDNTNAVKVADFLFDAESKSGIEVSSASVEDVVWYTNRVNSEGRCLCSANISQTFTIKEPRSVDGDWLTSENERLLTTENTETGERTPVSASSLSLTQNDKQALYFVHLFEDASSNSAFYVNTLSRTNDQSGDRYTLNCTYYFYASAEQSAEKLEEARIQAEAAAAAEE